jgi:hypothetical protein
MKRAEEYLQVVVHPVGLKSGRPMCSRLVSLKIELGRGLVASIGLHLAWWPSLVVTGGHCRCERNSHSRCCHFVRGKRPAECPQRIPAATNLHAQIHCSHQRRLCECFYDDISWQGPDVRSYSKPYHPLQHQGYIQQTSERIGAPGSYSSFGSTQLA